MSSESVDNSIVLQEVFSPRSWKETGPVTERKQFIEDGLVGGCRDLAGLCPTNRDQPRTGARLGATVPDFGRGGFGGSITRPPGRRGGIPAEMKRWRQPPAPWARIRQCAQALPQLSQLGCGQSQPLAPPLPR